MSSAKRGQDPVTDRPPERLLGCLLGGAIGDALGASIEFASLREIREASGPTGVRNYRPSPYGESHAIGRITDDTQMTLFTVEGIIRAIRREERGLGFTTAVLHHAYLRWLMTQDSKFHLNEPDGWLLQEDWLWVRRAPGATCLSALETWDGRSFGTPADNNSKGCGAVMRSAPIGFLITRFDERQVFDIAVEAAAYTHGHPTGQIAAGALALLTAHITQGLTLPDSLDATLQYLAHVPRSEETVNALRIANDLASLAPSAESVESLGGGWIAEEALAISVYCALQHQEAHEIIDALSLAVTHSGDSDSTGSICGNLLGALHGSAALPCALIENLDARHTCEQLAEDFNRVIVQSNFAEPSTIHKYPAW